MVNYTNTPTSAAGGDLSGTYPNPSVAKVGGVAASGTPSAGQVLVATGAAAASWGEPLGLWTPADQGLVAWNFDGPSAVSGGSSPLAVAGTLYVMAMRLPVAASVTNIVTYMTTGGGTLTSGQCFAALYQGAGGALIGTSADQSVAWASSGLKTMALAGGPFAVAAGVVYAAFWFNGTTGPAPYRTNGASTTFSNVGLAAGASRWGTADTGKTTTAPPTLGSITGAATAYWAALS